MSATKGNPADIQTVDMLLAKMRAGTQEVYEIEMRELKIPVRVLSIDELSAVRRDAIQKVSMQMGDDTDKALHTQKAVLRLASTLVPNSAPMLADKLLSRLGVDEINFLYNEYIAIMDRVNPALETIQPEQFRALVDALKKNTMSAKDLSLHQLRAICTAFQELIQRPATQTLPPDNVSGGQP